VSVAVAGKQALDALYWRAEILQALYWMRGEGIAESVEAVRLADFLVVDRGVLDIHMRELVSDGFLSSDGDSYALTALGVDEGGRSFQDEFGDLTRPAHYECGPGCWCQDPDHIGEPCPSHPVPVPEPEPEEPARDD
jgi:hypothetical protein